MLMLGRFGIIHKVYCRVKSSIDRDGIPEVIQVREFLSAWVLLFWKFRLWNVIGSV